MIYFISYGSNYAYEELSYQIVSKLSHIYPASFYKVYTAHDLPPKLNEYAKKYKRGHGYWAWKPWIVRRALSILEEGDIVLYVDGRCDVAEFGRPVSWFSEFMENTQFDLAAWQMDHLEKHWTTTDLIRHLVGSNLEEVVETGQYAATFHAWRVNQRSLRLAGYWCNFVFRNPSLCRDDPSVLPNDPNFKESRHDQSVFSLMVKMLKHKGMLKVATLDDAQVDAGNLLPHQKKHPHSKN